MHPRLLSDLADLEHAAAHRAAARRRLRRGLRRSVSNGPVRTRRGGRRRPTPVAPVDNRPAR